MFGNLNNPTDILVVESGLNWRIGNVKIRFNQISCFSIEKRIYITHSNKPNKHYRLIAYN